MLRTYSCNWYGLASCSTRMQNSAMVATRKCFLMLIKQLQVKGERLEDLSSIFWTSASSIFKPGRGIQQKEGDPSFHTLACSVALKRSELSLGCILTFVLLRTSLFCSASSLQQRCRTSLISLNMAFSSLVMTPG
jgi:hypothetical protein